MGTEAGVKLDNGKTPIITYAFHYFRRALGEVAKVSKFGAEKYTAWGWKSVDNGVQRYTDALGRHLAAEVDGPIDEESQCLHAAQVAWNALARLELMLCAADSNGRGKPEIKGSGESSAQVQSELRLRERVNEHQRYEDARKDGYPEPPFSDKVK